MTNKSNNLLKPAYVLHSRSFRDNSLLVDLLTLEHGRIAAIARGVKRAKSPLKGVLQPFNALLVAWMGRGELVTLHKIEPKGQHLALGRKHLMSGLYLNELLVRVLHHRDPQMALFQAYENTLIQLQSGLDPEPILRRFEIFLLTELGYGLQLSHVPITGEPIENGFFYYFKPQVGITLIKGQHASYKNHNFFPGEHLLAIHQGDLQDAEILNSAERLFQLALAPLLGQKPIMSRRLL